MMMPMEKEVADLEAQVRKVVFALDQSTTCCGYSLWEKNKLIQFDTYEPNNKIDSSRRIWEINQWFIEAIKKLKTVYKKILVVFEDIQLQNSINGSSKYFNNTGNVVTFKILAQLQGVLINSAIDSEVEWQLIAPTEWKSKVGIKSKYRKDQKKEAIDLVFKKYEQVVNEDAADAILLGSIVADNK